MVRHTGHEDRIVLQVSRQLSDKLSLRLAGQLPRDLQNYTVFVAGVPNHAAQLGGANALLRYFRTHKVSAVIRAKGMEGFGSNGGSE